MRGWKSALLLGALAFAARPALGADKPSDEKVSGDRQDARNPGGRSLVDARLGLSDEQAAKMRTVTDEQSKDAEPLRDALKVAVEKLRWQFDAKADPKDLSATLAEIDDDRRALEDLHEKSEKKIAGLLTPAQRAKRFLLETGNRPMRGDEGGFGRGRRPGREGRDGPGGPDRSGPPDERGGGDGPADKGGDGPP
jgi:Spy/CpxP family protein refolding chaperone